MDNHRLTNQIKKELETLLLQAILSVLEKITEEVIAMRKESPEKF